MYLIVWLVIILQNISVFLMCYSFEMLEFPDSELNEMVPVGTRSLLVQPILEAPRKSSSQAEKSQGFILLASSIDYAYTNKDKSWIAAVADKFRSRFC